MASQTGKAKVVQVEGAEELVAALKDVGRGFPGELDREFRKIADHVVGVAQQKMPWRTGAAAKSIQPIAFGKSAGIRAPGGGPASGHDRVGYYPWLDFGGGVYHARGVTSHSPIAHEGVAPGTRFRRGAPSGGRYLYPAIAESSGEIAEAAYTAMEKVAKAARLRITNG